MILPKLISRVLRKNDCHTFLPIHDNLKYSFNRYMSQWTSLMFKKPIPELKQYLETPVFKEMELFDPDLKSMQSASKLFVSHKHNNIDIIARTADSKMFPVYNTFIPEVALLGQSNSGKSTLLRAIFAEAPDILKRIRASKTPGSTKSLMFYQVGQRLCLVDTPGYGIKQPKWFQSSVMTYLNSRKNLVKAFILIDVKEGFNEWDDAALQTVKGMKLPFAIVLTKIDEVPDSERLKNFLFIQKMVLDKENNCFPQMFMLSSVTFEGLGLFLSFLEQTAGQSNKISQSFSKL